MAHNHTHSFVSGMNQVDGVYIMSEIRRIFGSIEDRVITVRWLPELACSIDPSPTLYKSMGYWAAHLPTHLKNHLVMPDMIALFVTQFSITIQRGIRVDSILIDDRGREYKQGVSW